MQGCRGHHPRPGSRSGYGRHPLGPPARRADVGAAGGASEGRTSSEEVLPARPRRGDRTGGGTVTFDLNGRTRKNAESDCIARYADTAETEALELPWGVVAEDVPFPTPVYVHVQGVVCCGFLLAPPFCFHVEHNFPLPQYQTSQSSRGNTRPPLFCLPRNLAGTECAVDPPSVRKSGPPPPSACLCNGHTPLFYLPSKRMEQLFRLGLRFLRTRRRTLFFFAGGGRSDDGSVDLLPGVSGGGESVRDGRHGRRSQRRGIDFRRVRRPLGTGADPNRRRLRGGQVHPRRREDPGGQSGLWCCVLLAGEFRWCFFFVADAVDRTLHRVRGKCYTRPTSL